MPVEAGSTASTGMPGIDGRAAASEQMTNDYDEERDHGA